MKNNNKILSIGITTYEEDKNLEELIWVIKNEISIYPNLKDEVEFFLYNDGGKNENTKKIIKGLPEWISSIQNDISTKSPSSGRNKIIDLAHGKYILFIDGDDNFISPIKDLIKELKEKKTSDILVSEVSKINKDGIVLKSPFIYTKKLFNCSDKDFKNQYHKMVVHQTGIWSVYRTEFLKKENIKYDKSIRYEDNLFLTKIALTKNVKWDRLKTKYYGWRVNLNGFSRGNAHVIMKYRLNLYNKVIEEIKKDTNNKFAPYLLFSVWNQTYSNIIRAYPGFKADEYEFFFKKLNEITFKNNKLIKELIKKSDKEYIDKYFRLASIGTNKSFLLIKTLQKYEKIKSKKRNLLFGVLKIFSLLPINSKKIFFTSQYGQYNDNSKYLYLQMKKNPKYKDYKFIFAVKDKKRSKDFINYDNRLLFFYHHYTAKRIYFNTWYNPDIKKRNKQTWIQLWHGVPYKKVHTDIETYFERTPVELVKKKGKAIRKWDYIWCVDNRNKEIFNNIFPNTKSIVKEYPKTEWLINNKNKDKLKEKYYNKFKLDSNKKYVLYAPTYRPYLFIPNINQIKELIPAGYELIIHKHPLLKMSTENEFLELNNIKDIQELILICDAVITDYSSIKYDFSKLNKQVIEYTPDKEIYNIIHGVY